MAWVTIVEANAYFDESLDSDKWVALTNKGGAINSAFRILTNHPGYEFPSEPTQKMKDANCEFALFLTKGTKRQDLQDQNVQSFSVGDFSESYSPSNEPSESKIFLPAKVKDLIQSYSKSAPTSSFFK